MIEHDGVPRETLEAFARADYFHASNNPRAVGRDQLLDHETYIGARPICEPYKLFDCSRENDGAAAVVLVSAERAKDLRQRPAYVLSAPTGSAGRWGARESNREPYASAGFESVARRMWEQSGYRPTDVDVAQVYENFTGMGCRSTHRSRVLHGRNSRRSGHLRESDRARWRSAGQHIRRKSGRRLYSRDGSGS